MSESTQKSPPPVDSTAALAETLGLSRWTISRVLNGHPGVKEATRRRVVEAMARLGFQPNAMARGLRGSQTRLIGVCFQEIETPVLARKVASLQNQLRQENYRAIIELTGGDPVLEEEVIRHFLAMRVDGIVLAGSTLAAGHPLVAQLRDGAAAAVAIDPAHNLPLPQVNLDREYAMELKVRHLTELGHRSFAILGMESDPIYGSRRMQGLRKAARRRGLGFRENFQSLSLPGYDLQDYNYGFQLGREYLALKRRASALICLNDRIALGACKVIQEAGVPIPADCSVIGFDNLEVTAWARPALTTIDQQIELMIATAVSMLMQSVRAREPSAERQSIRPSLRVRESTGPASAPSAPGRRAATVKEPSAVAPIARKKARL